MPRWGVSVYIQNSLIFKTKLDFSFKCGDTEPLALEIISEKAYNILSVLHRPTNNDFERFENFLTIFFKTQKTNKNVYITGDINLNLLDYSLNRKVNYLNLIYQNSTY